MKKGLVIGLILGVIIILLIAGLFMENVAKERYKEKNICKMNPDCEYIWYAGGCFTPEYVDKIMNRCRDGSGPCPSEEFPLREGVTCTCENKKCVTHG